MALMQQTKRAVFLDKDGTLLVNVPFNVSPSAMRLADGAVPGLRILHQAGFELIVVTNQSGVARGYFGEGALTGVRNQLGRLMRGAGAVMAGFYYCPHHPDGVVPEYAIACSCRKPAPGMLVEAARERELSLADCWLIGDTLDDVEAGRAAGCRTVLVDNGGETEWCMSLDRTPDHTVADLHEAALVIAGAGPDRACTNATERRLWTPNLRG